MERTMGNKMFYIIAIMTFMFISVSYGQGHVKVTGNLLRVKFDQTAINPADTIGDWQNDFQQEYQHYSWYFNHLSLKDSSYFFEHYDAYYSQMGSRSGIIIENNAGEEILQMPLCSGECCMPIYTPYYFEEPAIYKIPTGAWIINGSQGNYFVSNEGKFTTYVSYIPSDSTLGLILQSLLGRTNGSAVAAFMDNNQKYLYYKVDLSDSPIFDPKKAEQVYFSDNSSPQRILQLNDSLYLCKIQYNETQSYTFRIYEIQDNIFNYLKDIINITEPDSKWDWAFRNNKLYLGDYDIITFDYNDELISFQNERNICPFNAHDQGLNYAAHLTHDSLFIFDLNREAMISALKMPSSMGDDCFIDSPYVYINMVVNRIGVADENLSNLTYKLSAYPNPFNPQTTIAFTIPNAGKVELAVYDILGRKVTELLNEYRDKGSYEVKFNGADLASGIYFYTIKAGNFVKTEKLMLLK